MTATLTPELIAETIYTAIKAGAQSEPRTVQSEQGIIGPSDLGFCRQKAVLMMRGVQRTDSGPLWPAIIGTAIHRQIAEYLRAAFPGWTVDEQRVTATYPSGYEVPGTPDIIAPEWNAVVDLKTADGFEWVRREGSSQNHRYQRHTYALGAVAAGLLDPDKPIYVVNVYLDRSGREEKPYVTMEVLDPTLTDEVNGWIDDVTYALRTGEDASRDVAAPVCERICEFFTVCRGQLPVEDGDLITDENLIAAARMHEEAQALEKRAKRMKAEAKQILRGVDGVAAGLQVRWTHIDGQEVAAGWRDGYDRLDVRRVRGR